MTRQAPVRTEQQPAPAQVAEHTAWSTPGIKVLVAGIVGVLAGIALGWDSHKQASGTATALAWAAAIGAAPRRHPRTRFPRSRLR